MHVKTPVSESQMASQLTLHLDTCRNCKLHLDTWRINLLFTLELHRLLLHRIKEQVRNQTEIIWNRKHAFFVVGPHVCGYFIDDEQNWHDTWVNDEQNWHDTWVNQIKIKINKHMIKIPKHFCCIQITTSHQIWSTKYNDDLRQIRTDFN